MLLKKLLVIFCLLKASVAFGQDSLQLFNEQRNHIQHTGMLVLGGWAVANIAGGTAGYYHTSGSTRYFNQMTIIWNVVNLGAATAGYLGSSASATPLNAAEIVKRQQRIQRTFLVNGGLDIAYITTGLILHHAGASHNAERQQGYGSAIALQGAFLLLFDGTMYAAEKHNSNKLMRFLSRNQLLLNGKQVGMLLHF